MSGATARRGAWTALRQLLPEDVLESVRLGLTAIAAIYLAMLFELQDPEWAGWTVLSVSLATRASSLSKSLWRAIGSVVGATVSLLMMAAFAQDTLAFDLALAAWLAFVTLFATVERGQRSYGFALMGFTVPIIALGTIQTPDNVFHVAFARCSALLLGIACAHVSSVCVARSVQHVGRDLAAQMEATAATCAHWLGGIRDRTERGAAPLADILALDEAIAGAMVEQPSLRTGGRFVVIVPYRLLRLCTQGMLARWLNTPDFAATARLLAMPEHLRTPGTWLRRIAVVARLLREGRRIGLAYAPARPLAVDRDWVQARNNAIRTAIAVSLANALWYATGWSSGHVAVVWAALLSTLFAARADAADAARNFLLGGLLAALVGVTTHYTALTLTGHFGLLALSLLPMLMLAAIGRLDPRAAIAGGYAMVVLTFVGLHNVSTFDLGADLNAVLANLVGMAIAVAAFTALPPPADAARLQRRARRRMARDLRRAACARLWLSAPGNRRIPGRFIGPVSSHLAFDHLWLGRMARRLARLPDSQDGEPVLLCGALLIAMRRQTPALWGQAGPALWQARLEAGAALAELASRTEDALSRQRLDLLVRLVDALPANWPGLLPGAGDRT
ncbi:putative membrane protein YccC [Endobacter medicaginis]|uniref:Putative membrane protein YccC n=3 Tax=Endobacter medicaginis TaxID=1181271 RepID=A0A839V5L6_9PROT|nr:FUSC family protein [Endobacter medicaginis]MBB3174829.1 putative membrane protein YccC [Endobacter medicaginis]MCX5475639.1 FUSC family protein [Endobacter medicaginis]